jgi:hypothetical protein
MRDTWGSPGMDMPEPMVEEKFVECASPRMDRPAALRLLAALRAIETCPDINRIAALF